ncbi:MAG: OPT/YSL family transporter [Polyangiaceae bacterium]|nr:OPT/YSL family transporter [Polyangiaceae bacterium]
MVLGAVLSLCNIYSGLKIGWGTNMSITAALLGYAFWQLGQRLGKTSPFGIMENTVSQTAASAGASISSAGLVAPIPALTMLTGQTLAWQWLSVWVFSVACVGIVVGVGLRRQMLLVDKLPFPFGIATAETLKEMYARGAEAMARVRALLLAGGMAAAVKSAEELLKLPKVPVPGSMKLASGTATLKNLGFAFEPGLLFVGVGALIGPRACVSLLLGAAVGWGVIAPEVLDRGWAMAGKPGDVWFGPLVKWMLWPGVALMVSSSLTSFLLSARSIVRAFAGARGGGRSVAEAEGYDFRRKRFFSLLAVVALVSVVLQVALFGIRWYVALFGVGLTFVLAIVAGRVSGETGITPVGAMGKVTQLSFGAVAPGDATTNLMAANVTGGAASQCADMLHDLKAGHLLGAWPRPQAIAQVLGVLAGALVGSAAYLVLVPDPKGMLLTKDWPAPAVAQWKAVAEVFQKGIETMPAGALHAIAIAAAVGVVLAIAERLSPPKVRRFVPSPASMGLALVVPAYYSIMMFLGGVIAWLVARRFKNWSDRFLVVIASGLIAGESLAGVAFAIEKMFKG